MQWKRNEEEKTRKAQQKKRKRTKLEGSGRRLGASGGGEGDLLMAELTGSREDARLRKEIGRGIAFIAFGKQERRRPARKKEP